MQRPAVVDGRGGVRVWDVDAGRILWSATAGVGVSSLAWSPDAAELWAGGTDGALQVWDAEAGEVLATFPAHASRVAAMVSDGGALLATGSDDGSIQLWDWASATRLESRSELGEVLALAVSPDGTRLLAGLASGELALFGVPGLERVRDVGAHPRPRPETNTRLRAVAYRPDGRQCASASDDYSVGLWDLQGREPARFLAGHSTSVRGVAYTPDGVRLLTAAPDNTVRFWDPETGTALAVLNTGHAGVLEAMAFGADGRWLFTLDRSGRLEIRSAPP